MILAVLFAGNLGGDSSHTTSSRSTFDVGPATNRAAAVERDQTPLLFQDPVKFERPIFVQHTGTDPRTGWTAFDAANGTCVLTWRRETHDFTDCNGTRFPADGGSQHHYPTRIDHDDLIVDLNPDAPSTSS